MSKKYLIKVFDKDGTALQVVDSAILRSEIEFQSELNGGQGELQMDLTMSWDDPPSWTDPFNFVRVFVFDAQNPRGRLLYSGVIVQRIPNVIGREEYISLTVFGLVGLLSFSLYKDGSSFDVTHSAQDPKDVLEDIIDHFQLVYPPSSGDEWIGYNAVTNIRDGSQIETFGSNITYTFEKNVWSEAIDKLLELTDSGWYWYIDQGGDVIFREKSTSADHIFTVGKDVQDISAPENIEEIINSVTLAYDGGTTAAQEDATSISAYGKREQYVDDQNTTDSATAVSKAQRIRDENKDPKIQATIVVNSEYDFESIKPGDTCKVRNYKKGSVVLNDNMLIVGVTYTPELCTLELEGKRYDLTKEIKEVV